MYWGIYRIKYQNYMYYNYTNRSKLSSIISLLNHYKKKDILKNNHLIYILNNDYNYNWIKECDNEEECINFLNNLNDLI
jgi:hypothetical protein